MRKQLFIINNLKMGGAENSLINLANYLNEKNNKITIVIFGKDDKKDLNYKLNENIELIYLNLNEQKYKIYAILFPKLIVRKINKILKINEYYSITAALELFPTYVVRKIKHKNKIYQVHSDLEKIINNIPIFIKPIINRLNKKYTNNDQHVIVSEHTKNIFKKLNPNIKDKNLDIVRNIIDINGINVLANENLEIKLSNNKLNVISIGRLVKEKAFERIIDIAKQMPNANFKIIGEGPERKNLEIKISKNKVNNVSLLGEKKNPYPYLKASDVSLLTSITEGSPTVIYESLALNKPFVATNVANLKLTFQKTDCIILEQNATIQDFIFAIKNVKLNPNFQISNLNEETFDQINEKYVL